MDYREAAEHIFLAGVKGVLPGRIIDSLISVRGPALKIGDLNFNLDETANIFIIGAGKASAAMGHYVEKLLGKRITGGHIITKYGFYCRLDNIEVTEAGHPVPDINSFAATKSVLEIADKAAENDLVICLFSGGGSSLLADFPEHASPEEIMDLNDLLVKSGATIGEMNCIRKHLSQVKGGQLMKHIWPATCISVILSDVTGDPPDTIASGPTVPDNSTFADALRIIGYRQLSDKIPANILKYLDEGVRGIRQETPKPGDPVFSKSFTFIAGSNKTALQSAKTEAEKLGFSTFILTSELFGDPEGACSWFREMILKYKKNSVLKKPVCLLFGGELTVRMTGNGRGGRNQHLALTAALRLTDIPGVTFLSAGTDGNDGNTEAAGAVVDAATIKKAETMNIDPKSFLDNFDSCSFFESVGGPVITGSTMTNVMDLVVIIVE
jgi:hydroxypyruvate reductase/glycerate 2-kinase